ncbi:hypothetical protein EEB14_33930 [Rhodococcus sp. WS4]|nr:hypothetical protein EEB14_33930 [Rhodococcus sp. WS4]
MRPTTLALRAITGLVIASGVAACGNPDSGETIQAAEQTTTPPAATSTTAPAEADAADYGFITDRYRFKLAGTPLRECVVAPNTELGGHNVYCSVSFPPGTPPVSNPPFSGPPNSIALRPDGFYSTIAEGGPPGAKLLPENTRLKVGDVQCTSLAGGVDCQNGPAGFRFVDGELATRGPQVERPTAPPTTSTTTAPTAPTDHGSPMEHYTDGTEPAAIGTDCGAATGRRVVRVLSGSISCTDALATMEAYGNLPPGDYGNANIRTFDGWECASPTAATQRETGYGRTCRRGDIHLSEPASPFN